MTMTNYFHILHNAKSTAKDNSLHPYATQPSLKFPPEKKRKIDHTKRRLPGELQSYLHCMRPITVVGLGTPSDLFI